MSLLEDELKVLEADLTSKPMRISAYHDLPFCIFRYDHWREFECRKRLRLLSISLEQNHKKQVTFISLARLLWRAIEETEGIEAIVEAELQRGFQSAQRSVQAILDDKEFRPLPDLVDEKVRDLNPEKDVVFLVRTATLAPAMYRCSVLLDHLHGRTMVPIVLFYPGTGGQTNLCFMNLPERGGLGVYNYRVKIYGGES